MRKVAHANGAPPDLVLVSRTDPAPGRPDLALARRILPQPVKVTVERQD